MLVPWVAALGLWTSEPTPAPPPGEGEAWVDESATAAGLRARLGARAEAWTVTVQPSPTPGAVHVVLVGPDGVATEREVVLGEETAQDRGRELSSALALLIEQRETKAASEVAPARSLAVHAAGPAGWVGVEARGGIATASPSQGDVGVGLLGGIELVRGHVQPLANASWSRARRFAGPRPAFDVVRFGAGALGGGAWAGDRLWAGGGALVQAIWLRIEDRETATRWAASVDLFAQLQVRTRRGFWSALRAGVELVPQPVRAKGVDRDLTWGPVRFFAGIALGMRFRGRDSGASRTHDARRPAAPVTGATTSSGE